MLNDLFRHMEWADAEMWKKVFETGTGGENADGAGDALDSKIHFWVHHIHMVQHAFRRLWQGEALDDLSKQEDFESLGALARWGREGHRALQAYIAQAGDEQLRRVLEIPWTADLEKRLGHPVADVEVGQSAFQVVMHSTHHRAQVSSRLRELGGEPSLSDFIAWLWQGKPEADWPARLDGEGGGQ